MNTILFWFLHETMTDLCVAMEPCNLEQLLIGACVLIIAIALAMLAPYMQKHSVRMEKFFPYITFNVVIVISHSGDTGDHRRKKSKLFKLFKRHKRQK